MLPSKKSTGRPVKLSRTDALAEELRGAIATLADTTLNDGKRLHIIQCFIDNVAYAEVYIAMLDKPSLKKKFYVKMLKNYP